MSAGAANGRTLRPLVIAAALSALLVAVPYRAFAGRPAFLAPDADNSAAFARDPNARQPDGSTALQWAVYEGNLREVQRLLHAGADVQASNNYGATALQLAAEAGDPAILHALLKAGANPNSASSEGQTALMVVARTGNLENAKELLRAGADANARESWGGQTALMWAAAAQQPAM
ncbi:MAG TPA: ankyrin repeat domain-containing protein, partial [Steroidobacteraceae bacterium]|nr:ankyrin repeat domain-containing protein [Steroidobacteraceae bacterium]